MNHAPDHAKLLGILASEIGSVRHRGVQQLQYHGRHAPEVTRTPLAFERSRHIVDVHVSLESGGIHAPWRRKIYGGHPFFAQQPEVPFLVPGVALEILAGAELSRVHEDRRHGLFILGAGASDQREVTFVKKPHGRHQAERRRMVSSPGAHGLRVGQEVQNGNTSASSSSGCVRNSASVSGSISKLCSAVGNAAS